jgi:uncharacterized protein (TIGR02231 family)
MSTETALVNEWPNIDAGRRVVDLPIHRVTVLEDRAEVIRSGMLSMTPGIDRIRIANVSPVIRDVSLQTQIGDSEGATSRVQRVRRVRHADRPEAIAALEAEREALDRKLQALHDRQRRAEQRHHRLAMMTVSAAEELPEDASWGRGDPSAWQHAFDTLFERSRAEDQATLEAYLTAQQLLEDRSALQRRISLLSSPSTEIAAHIDIDVVVDAATSVEVIVRYTVPSAMWRPLHRAHLDGASLHWTPRAAVWQHTGEDWNHVRLRVSTARTALGTDPPLLADDPLLVQRKPDAVAVGMREVEVQSTGPRAAATGAVQLPGVDDGGEVRHLDIPGTVSIPSTGAPTFFDLPAHTSEAAVELVAMPEVLDRVVTKVTATHPGSSPLLAGPVELLRSGGAFGWSEISYTAPGAAMELSFGPDDTVRVQRKEKQLSDKTDPVDRWRRRTNRVRIYLSNAGTQAKSVTITERIPVSEVEEVRIEGVTTSLAATPDADGLLRWTVLLAANGTHTLELVFVVATAPDVEL